MIDLKDLRERADKYRRGAADKGMAVDIDGLLAIDARLRAAQTELENLVAEQNKIGKEIGQLAGTLKKASDTEKAQLQAQMKSLQERPTQIKARTEELKKVVAELEPQRDAIWLTVPQPADADVPVGKDSSENREVRRWSPPAFDPAKSFEDNKGFAAKSHVELGAGLGILDFERGVKMAGSRSYVLVGDGMRLHQAVLRFAFDLMVNERGFTGVSVPVLVREEMMIGTAFFPAGREQAYQVTNPDAVHLRDELENEPVAASELHVEPVAGKLVIANRIVRTNGHTTTLRVEKPIEGYLTGTGEVGLMGLYAGELLDGGTLPLKLTTVSTCFRREAGAAGKDTAGLYRIHQFDKVEQVVICRADEAESRAWHRQMMETVDLLLRRLEIPYRVVQCCTGDLGPKNADQLDFESWMPSRGPGGKGEYGETHSASRLYDYQCRRLNLRYRDPQTKKASACHSLNNTVAASPRILIPLLELNQNADGSVTIPAALRPYMNGQEKIESR